MAMFRFGSVNFHRGYNPGSEEVMNFALDKSLDVLLVQDVYRRVVERENFRDRWPHCNFADTTVHFDATGQSENTKVGIGVFTTLPVVGKSSEAYLLNMEPVPKLLRQAVTLAPNGNASAKDAALLATCESKIACSLKLSVDGKPVTVVTTHGPWRGEGEINEELDRAMCGLLDIVMSLPGPLVMAGTSLFDRDDYTYRMFTNTGGLQDCIPRSLTNTIDWKNRGVTDGRDRVTSHILARGCKVFNVELVFGIAEHAALAAYVDV
ncbi:hypothetical protein HYW59_01735 [Candidatus Kaiserbacteria bacterium]|nr:hypothetical protein [Candidatus Kaiserbacteria bacterium]